MVKPSLWFTLLELARIGGTRKAVRISTTELSDSLGCSQQSASRHLKVLEESGLVSRRIESGGSLVRVPPEGRRALEDVYLVLRGEFDGAEEAYELVGTVFSGMYQGGYYITRPGYRDQILEKLGFDPYPGTLNLRLREADLETRRRLDGLAAFHLKGFRESDRAFGGALCYPLKVNHEVEGALIVAERTTYDLSVMEVISPVNLRERFGLQDGDPVTVTFSGSFKVDDN